jgi:3-deoxy-D-manno-octulosonic-acid transferase
MISFIADFFYLIFIVVVLPYYIIKFISVPSSRLGLFERFGFVIPPKSGNPVIWLHGASVGELKSAEGLIKKLREQYKDYELVLSSITPTAQLLLRKTYPDLYSITFPIDLSWIVKRSINSVEPKLIILLEQEIWPNFIKAAYKRNIPVVLIGARITEKSLKRYGFLSWVFKPALNRISRFGIQDESYMARYKSLGVPEAKMDVTGNMKYDSIPIFAGDDGVLLNSLGIKPDDIVLVGGSTHSPEEEVLLDSYKVLKSDIKNLRLVLAPRHPERFRDVENLIKAKGYECVRYSKNDDAKPQSAVILIDTIGELMKGYRLATLVFVGGSLVPKGGHNILEPVALGKPVIFGPYMYNFQESTDALIKVGACIMIQNKNELTDKIRGVLTGTDFNEMGKRGLEFIKSKQGATDNNLRIISKMLSR